MLTSAAKAMHRARHTTFNYSPQMVITPSNHANCEPSDLYQQIPGKSPKQGST